MRKHNNCVLLFILRKNAETQKFIAEQSNTHTNYTRFGPILLLIVNIVCNKVSARIMKAARW